VIDQSSDVWTRRFSILLASVSLWRLLFLVITPLDLVPDEAYYWDWSRHLDWGYYSKPPLIAWINALSTGLLGASAVSLRLPAVIFGIIGIVAVFSLARRMFDSRVGFWAAAALLASSGSSLSAFLMTIDAPFLCFWSLSLYSLWRAINEETMGWLWWILCAVTVGLGLLSKQMMIAFLVILPLFLGVSPRDRHLFRRPWPYLLIVLSLSALLPVIWWNMQHAWITLHHTAHHFDSNPREDFYFVKTLLDFIGSQLLLLSPLSWLLFVAIASRMIVYFRKLERNVQFLLLFSAVPLSGFFFMALRQRINGNWPAVLYPAGFILLAAWGCGAISVSDRLDRSRKLFLPGVLTGTVLAITTYALTFFLSISSVGGSALDPTLRLKGWQRLGQEVGSVWRRLPESEKTFLLTTKRQYASELAFYVPGRPRVYTWPDRDGAINSQYDIWPGPVERLGWDSLVLLKAGRKPPSEMVAAFNSMELLGKIDIPTGPGGKRQFSLYRGHTLKAWPERASRHIAHPDDDSP
jgi:4-amino-4-deoxy-L-arabinose transferase-like glycosyltransferase